MTSSSVDSIIVVINFEDKCHFEFSRQKYDSSILKNRKFEKKKKKRGNTREIVNFFTQFQDVFLRKKSWVFIAIWRSIFRKKSWIFDAIWRSIFRKRSWIFFGPDIFEKIMNFFLIFSKYFSQKSWIFPSIFGKILNFSQFHEQFF